jgi:hypothetical protein
LIDRAPVLVWAGAGLLGWIAGEVISTDPQVSRYVIGKFGEPIAQQMEIAAAISGILLVIAIGGLWRQLRLTHARTKVAEEEVVNSA